MKVLGDIHRVYFVDGKKLTQELESEIKNGAYTPKVIICQVTTCAKNIVFGLNKYESKGKAVCDKEDVFDLNIGKKIAYTKAINKINEKIIKQCNKRISLYKQEIEKCEKTLSYCKEDLLNRNKDVVSFLFNILPNTPYELVYDSKENPKKIVGVKELDKDTLFIVSGFDKDGKYESFWEQKNPFTNTITKLTDNQIICIKKDEK